MGLKESPKEELDPRPSWLALSILLLWMGWFGFNSGSVLVLNHSAQVVALNTFLAAASSFLSTMFVVLVVECEPPNLFYADNGILMGLIVITPPAGFVSPASAAILRLLS